MKVIIEYSELDSYEESKILFDRVCRLLISSPKRVEVSLVNVFHQTVHYPGCFVCDCKVEK